MRGQCVLVVICVTLVAAEIAVLNRDDADGADTQGLCDDDTRALNKLLQKKAGNGEREMAEF